MNPVQTSPATAGTLVWKVEKPSSPEVVPDIRHAIQDAMRDAGVVAPVFLVAVSEVVTNAYRYSGYFFVVIFAIDDQRAELTVLDDNLVTDVVIPAPNSSADLAFGEEDEVPEGGYGLRILAGAADYYSVSHGIWSNGHKVKSVRAGIELSPAA